MEEPWLTTDLLGSHAEAGERLQRPLEALPPCPQLPLQGIRRRRTAHQRRHASDRRGHHRWNLPKSATRTVTVTEDHRSRCCYTRNWTPLMEPALECNSKDRSHALESPVIVAFIAATRFKRSGHSAALSVTASQVSNYRRQEGNCSGLQCINDEACREVQLEASQPLKPPDIALGIALGIAGT